MPIELRGVCPLLSVHDMPASVRFYRDQLGFSVVSTSPVLGEDSFHWCLLRHGTTEIMLNTAYEFNDERPAEHPRSFNDPYGICLYMECPDVDGAFADLRARGVAVQEPQVARYGMKQMYFSDPDGYLICFQWTA